MASLVNVGEGVPLRLYFQIGEDEVADAEVIARASLAFVAGVKEIAYILDPSFHLRVGIEGHTDGSLWEDFLLLAGKAKKEYLDHPYRYGLAFSAIAWIMQPPLERWRDNAWEPYLPPPASEHRAEAERAVAVVSSGNVAVREKQQFYRETSRDTAILGVAANVERTRPPLVVPRADFRMYSGDTPLEASDDERLTTGPVRLTIVSPVLEVSTSRRWKFSTPTLGEFGAAVKDRAFLERIVAGQTTVRMRGGVQLDVDLHTKERLQEGVWTIVERQVAQVLDIIEPPASAQGSLLPDEGD